MMRLETFSEDGFAPLFDGNSLNGWHTKPRSYGTLYPGGPQVEDLLRERKEYVRPDLDKHPARWKMENGVVIGEQATRGYGGYLVSNETYGEFELVLEAKPDWPADTGIMIRRLPDTNRCIQVLLDHRRSGSIGGFYGNQLANFHATNFNVNAKTDETGKAIGLQLDDAATSVEPITQAKIDLLDDACDPKDFLAVWRWDDWNEFRIRCVGGALPTVTTWINGLKVAELNIANIKWPLFNPDEVAAALGEQGHIAFEVHDNDVKLGDARWAPGAQCRWRNVRIKNL